MIFFCIREDVATDRHKYIRRDRKSGMPQNTQQFFSYRKSYLNIVE